ncbi:MAG TPA: hypothetical protein VMZ52_17530 [Bryobacteraceae bacterium]|nr:hypothetical protein [Bryobacteraceae bacterium]
MTEQTQRPGTPILDQIGSEIRNMFHGLEPSEAVVQHFRNSRIEFLKGIRQIIDNRIAHASRASDRGTKVTVE